MDDSRQMSYQDRNQEFRKKSEELVEKMTFLHGSQSRKGYNKRILNYNEVAQK